ncbi:hypothetical protein HNQ77_000162 [Silvibacterium bohemicum]|uniref:Uncharacterized protein n=1 Tax=Silvibacterium bohemicum TaxID=1577686 RepID=A0A841JW61_9BACT|nr:hypothetical protein [Silvibacterium bohemicum]
MRLFKQRSHFFATLRIANLEIAEDGVGVENVFLDRCGYCSNNALAATYLSSRKRAVSRS